MWQVEIIFHFIPIYLPLHIFIFSFVLENYNLFLPMCQDLIKRKQGFEIGSSDDALPKQVQGKLLYLM